MNTEITINATCSSLTGIRFRTVPNSQRLQLFDETINTMRTMHVEITIEKPQALGKDGEMPKGVSKTTTVNVPVPDLKDWDDAAAWERCFRTFKKWDSDGYMEEAPSVGSVMEAGVKVLARAEGQQRINEAVRKALGKSGKKGKGSTVSFTD